MCSRLSGSGSTKAIESGFKTLEAGRDNFLNINKKINIDLPLQAKYPGVRTFLNRCVASARKTGYVESMAGRRRRIPDITAYNPYTRYGCTDLPYTYLF